MILKKNYENYLEVTVEDVEQAGFTPRHLSHESGTTYYVSNNCEYVLAVVKYGYWVIIDKQIYEANGYNSIYMVFKEYHNDKILPVPYTTKGCRSVRLHRDVMNAPAGIQVDHINHNPNCCIKENLRLCDKEQNRMNRQDECGVYEYRDTEEEISFYAYELSVDVCEKDKITLIRNKGFSEVKRTSKKVTFRSNGYESEADCYMAFRDFARILYQGTEMEEFVYDIENDFSETFCLWVHYYILGDITKEEMHQMNLEYWRNKMGSVSIKKQYK